jgi:hypothetical protein
MKQQFTRNYLASLREPAFVPMALRVSLVVGTLLFAINHGMVLIYGEMTRNRWLSALITDAVPYAVNIHAQYVSRQRSQSTVPSDRSVVA